MVAFSNSSRTGPGTASPFLFLGESVQLLERAGIPRTLPAGAGDPGVIFGDGEDIADAFVAAVAKHRHFERETDPLRA